MAYTCTLYFKGEISMNKIPSYPLFFETEETLSVASYGRNARQYRLPTYVSHISKRAHHVKLASLETSESGVELMVTLEQPPGQHFQEGAYYLRMTHNGKYFTPKEENGVDISINLRELGAGFVFQTPNELKYQLASAVRKTTELKEFHNHAIGRISVYYPYLNTTVRNELETLINTELQLLSSLNAGKQKFEFTVEYTFQNGHFEAMIYAYGEELKNNLFYNVFSDSVKKINQVVKHNFFSDISFKARKRKVYITTPAEQVSWYVCEDFFEDVIVRKGYYSMHKNPKGGIIAEITYKNMSVGVRVKSEGNIDELKYALYIAENDKRRKDAIRYDESYPTLNSLLESIILFFKEQWNQDILSKLVVKKLTQQNQLWSRSEWCAETLQTLKNEIQDAFEFSAYKDYRHSASVLFIAEKNVLVEKSAIEPLDTLFEKILQ